MRIETAAYAQAANRIQSSANAQLAKVLNPEQDKALRGLAGRALGASVTS